MIDGPPRWPQLSTGAPASGFGLKAGSMGWEDQADLAFQKVLQKMIALKVDPP